MIQIGLRRLDQKQRERRIGTKTTKWRLDMDKSIKKVLAYLEELLLRHKLFTGKLELNFKDGELMDINETRRTKYKEEGK